MFQYFSLFGVSEVLELNCYVIIQSRCPPHTTKYLLKKNKNEKPTSGWNKWTKQVHPPDLGCICVQTPTTYPPLSCSAEQKTMLPPGVWTPPLTPLCFNSQQVQSFFLSPLRYVTWGADVKQSINTPLQVINVSTCSPTCQHYSFSSGYRRSFHQEDGVISWLSHMFASP